MSDPALDQLEAELNESRFKAWDVETFLADRHRAKIDALTAKIEALEKPHSGWAAIKEIVIGLIMMGLMFIGFASIVIVGPRWLATGEFPIRLGKLDQSPQAPPAHKIEQIPPPAK